MVRSYIGLTTFSHWCVTPRLYICIWKLENLTFVFLLCRLLVFLRIATLFIYLTYIRTLQGYEANLFQIFAAAIAPGAQVMPPPGWLPLPAIYNPAIGVL